MHIVQSLWWTSGGQDSKPGSIKGHSRDLLLHFCVPPALPHTLRSLAPPLLLLVIRHSSCYLQPFRSSDHIQRRIIMAQSLTFAAACFVVFMAILAVLTCEARATILDQQEVVQKSASAEIQRHVLIPGSSSTASHPSVGSGAEVIHDVGTAPTRNTGPLDICTHLDISITNNAVAPASTWLVQILNNCRCPVSNLVLNCPNFSSGTKLNPNVIKLNGDGTCLVKNGQTIAFGEMLTFTYFEVYKENLWVKSANYGSCV